MDTYLSHPNLVVRVWCACDRGKKEKKKSLRLVKYPNDCNIKPIALGLEETREHKRSFSKLKSVLPSISYLFVFRKTERSKDKSIS